MTNADKPLIANEFDPESAGLEGARNIERAQMKIIERRNWPMGTRPDGLTYSLEAERAMRPLMANNDLSADEFEYDSDGEMIWIFVNPGATEKPTETAATGTYREIAGLAAKLNRIQDESVGGRRGWNYTPALIEPEKAAA